MNAVTEQKQAIFSLHCGLQLLLCPCRKDGVYPTPERGTLLVIDDRMAADPSFRIVESYRITQRQQMREILLFLTDYAAAHPTEKVWQRTIASMEKEWVIHNIAYGLRLFPRQTRDVDLNNGEENNSWRYFIRRGMGILCRRVLRAVKKK